ncbi:16S rRNA (cytosine(1402)-N(4))-methyltransferase RsmH [Gemmatimonadota bacterium]
MSETHIPVLANEVARLADGRRRLVDCTVGDGGHAVLLLQGGGHLVAIDRDPDAISVAKTRIGFADVEWLNCCFADRQALEAIRRFSPDLVLFDLGVSSRQIDSDSRGFSFRRDVPLDMRMTSSLGPTGAELLNTLDGGALAQIFRDYADEPRAKHLANAIVRRRSTSPFSTSDDLVNAARSALGPRTGPADFARLFQAVRIEVNGEIRALEETLPVVLDALVPDGIVVVISYHSAEDRVVKRQFREWARTCVCPTGVPICTCRGRALGTQVTRKPTRPTAEEIVSNPRARSAKMRVFRKADAS